MSTAKKKKLNGLTNLSALQTQLDEERKMLKLYVIKAKQEWSERRATNGRTQGEGYYEASPGELIGPEKTFKVDERIGSGVFSSVFKCTSTADGRELAVKFIRTNAMMRKVSEKEVETYRYLAKMAPKKDPEGAKVLVRLVAPETFEHKGHLCLVFNLLKCDLRVALQKYGQGKGLPIATVKQIGKQLLMGLRALQRLKIIHADLKPDNVLMSMDKSLFQITDFGSSMSEKEQIRTAYVQPRYYRAPEVMLGIPYSTMIDIWSLGTTLFELASSKMLFNGDTNNQMLHLMLATCGQFPSAMLSAGEHTKKHFRGNDTFVTREPTEGQRTLCEIPLISFEEPLKPILSLLETALQKPPGLGIQRLADLITQCLILDPSERIKPEKALAHPFLGNG